MGTACLRGGIATCLSPEGRFRIGVEASLGIAALPGALAPMITRQRPVAIRNL